MSRNFRLLIFLAFHPKRIIKEMLRHIDQQYMLVDNSKKIARFFEPSKNKVSTSRRGDLISWICVPSDSRGGGMRTISRFVLFLDALGVKQEILIYNNNDVVDLVNQENILRGYFKIPDNIPILKYNSAEILSFAVATAWQTWIPAIECTNSDESRLIFLQDDEREFQAKGDNSLLIEFAMKKYKYAIAAGSWLVKVAKDVGIENCSHFDFGVDSEYFPASLGGRKKIVAYFQPDKERRLPGLLLAIVNTVADFYPNWEFQLVGYGQKQRMSKNVNILGSLTPIELAAIYRDSKIGIVLNNTNASLVPYEMRASGLHVLTNSGENVEWLGEFEGIHYVEKDWKIMSEYLISLIENSGNEFFHLDTKIFNTWESQINKSIMTFVKTYPNMRFSRIIHNCLQTF